VREIVFEILVDLILDDIERGRHLFEVNPYHDAQGRFTSKDAAVAYQTGAMAAARAAGEPREGVRVAIKAALDKYMARYTEKPAVGHERGKAALTLARKGMKATPPKLEPPTPESEPTKPGAVVAPRAAIGSSAKEEAATLPDKFLETVKGIRGMALKEAVPVGDVEIKGTVLRNATLGVNSDGEVQLAGFAGSNRLTVSSVSFGKVENYRPELKQYVPTPAGVDTAKEIFRQGGTQFIGKPERVEAVIRALSELPAEHLRQTGLRQVVVADSKEAMNALWVWEGGAKIVGNKAAPIGWYQGGRLHRIFLAPNATRGDIHHEFGHALQEKMGDEGKRVAAELAPHAAKISEYAKVGDSETFAEAYSVWMGKNEQLRTRMGSSEVAKIMDDLFKRRK
jgi:hypothetical protein